MSIKNTYYPDYAIHPGEYLEEIMNERELKKSDLAMRSGLEHKQINQIVGKNEDISSPTALALEKAMGVSAVIWNNLNANYLLFQAKREENQKIQTQKGWIEKFPLNEMIKRGIISTKKDTTTCIKEVLTFFRVSSIEAWEKYYKIKAIKYRKSKSFSEDFYSTMIWLRLGEIQAEKIDTASFDKGKFEKKLFKIRELTNEDQFEEAMVSLCAEAGVALTFVSELKKTHLSGATLWQTPNKAVIILSLRYKSDDHFWFSFFHEAGHILLHGKGDVFIDYKEKEADRKKEEAANTFAQNMLMPEEDYDRFVSENTKFYESTIKQFAEQQGIAPGIVVGRLQHDKHINYKSNNQLKRKLKLCEEI